MPWNLVKSPRLQIFLENIKCVKAKPSAQQYLSQQDDGKEKQQQQQNHGKTLKSTSYMEGDMKRLVSRNEVRNNHVKPC